MSKIVERVMQPGKHRGPWFFAAMMVLAVGVVYWTFTGAIELSGFAGTLAKAVLGMWLLYTFDRIVLGRVDTKKQIVEEKNVAYAMWLMVYGAIVAAALVSF